MATENKAAFRKFPMERVQRVVERLQLPTIASQAAQDRVLDARSHQYGCFRQNAMDYDGNQQRACARESEIREIVERVRCPTTASIALTHNYDAQQQQLEYLRRSDSRVCRYEPVDSEALNEIVARLGTSTVASRGGITIEAKFPTRPKPRGSKRRGRRKIGYRTVSKEEVTEIVQRLRASTISSEGGKSLLGKKYDYQSPTDLKTLPVIPGLETKFTGRKKLTEIEIDKVVKRISKRTKAFESKTAPPNPDDHPAESNDMNLKPWIR